MGEDDRRITEGEEGGVALAAIQGLNEKLETQNAALKLELSEIKSMRTKLRTNKD